MPKEGEGKKVKTPVKMAKVKLPVNGTALSESHVVILISLTTITKVEVEKLEALVDLLKQKPPKKVTIALTAGLKGLNFWDFPCYDPKVDHIPSEESVQAALKLEGEWQEKIQYICEPLRQGSELKIMLWKDIIAVENYNRVYQDLLKHYGEDQSCRDAVQTTMDIYLKTLKEYDPAKPEEQYSKKTAQVIRVDHKPIAKEKVIEYLLKEGPLLSIEVLDCDRILYTRNMTPALSAFYHYLNRDRSQPCRWWPVKIKARLLEDPSPDQLVGYSGARAGEKVVNISIGRQRNPKEDAEKVETDKKEIKEKRTYSAAAQTQNAMGTVSFHLTDTNDLKKKVAEVLSELKALIHTVDTIGDPNTRRLTRTLILSGVNEITQQQDPLAKKQIPLVSQTPPLKARKLEF